MEKTFVFSSFFSKAKDILRKNAKKIMYISFVLLLMTIFIANPKRYITSVFQGILLYSQTVLPSLFPFFFLTFLLTHIGGVRFISKLFSPLARMYGLNDEAAFVIVMSFLSGYPIGAKLTADYFRDGLITEREAITLSAVASTSGPVFIVGTVGAMMLNDVKLGFFVYACHILGALVNGFLYRKKDVSNTLLHIEENKSENLLKEAVYSSVISVLCVGGFIAVSSFVIEIMKTLCIIPLLQKTFFFLPDERLSEGVAVSLFEMTNGIYVLALIKDVRLLLPAVTFAVSFGGVSVLLQCSAFLSTAKVKPSKMLLQKITGALIASVMAYIFSLFL